MSARISTLLAALVLVGGGSARAQASTPAETLVGQQVLTCNARVQVSVTVTSGLWWQTIAGVAPAEGAMWLVVFYDASTLGTAGGSVASTLRVRDEQGREATPEDPSGQLSTFLVDFYDLDGSGTPVLPGAITPAFVLFVVAEDAQSLALLADPVGCA